MKIKEKASKHRFKLTFILIGFSLWTIQLAGQSLPNSDFEIDEKLALEVYDNIKLAIGDKRRDWPNLQLLGIESKVASFVPLDNVIQLDQKAIRVCRLFGNRAKDALAFIIGHELTHFYQEHDWKESGFVATFLVKKDKFAAFRNHERKADIYGAFIAQQAGYRTIPIVPNLLEYIYEHYQLATTANEDYPSLNERKALANDACKVAADLVDAYQTANYAMIVGRYEIAYLLYDFVGNSIQFKELYNNLGLCNLLQYYYQDADNQLVYPFQLAPYIPILRDDKIRTPTTLLNTAIIAFEKVNTEFDSNYFPSLLNLSIAYNWDEKTAQSEKLIDDLNNSTSNILQPISQLTIGNFIADIDTTQSIRIYKSLLKNEYVNALALKNIQYLRNGKPAKELPLKTPTQDSENGVDGIPSLTFFKAYNRQIEINNSKTLQAVELPNSYLTKFDKFTIQRVYSPSVKTQRGIHIGSTKSMIQTAYPSIQFHQIGYSGGFYLIDFEKGLIFKCNVNGVVKEWVLFKVY